MNDLTSPPYVSYLLDYAFSAVILVIVSSWKSLPINFEADDNINSLVMPQNETACDEPHLRALAPESLGPGWMQ